MCLRCFCHIKISLPARHTSNGGRAAASHSSSVHPPLPELRHSRFSFTVDQQPHSPVKVGQHHRVAPRHRARITHQLADALGVEILKGEGGAGRVQSGWRQQQPVCNSRVQSQICLQAPQQLVQHSRLLRFSGAAAHLSEGPHVAGRLHFALWEHVHPGARAEQPPRRRDRGLVHAAAALHAQRLAVAEELAALGWRASCKGRVSTLLHA